MQWKNLVVLRMTLLNAHGSLSVDLHGQAAKVIGEETEIAVEVSYCD
jgi:hypothetical protein